MVYKICGLDVNASDFPGHMSLSIDFCGCNLNCPYCNKVDCVQKKNCESKSLMDLLTDIEEHRPLVSGVILTGGEPLNQDISDLIRAIKGSGMAVKLETNGMFPHKLSRLVSTGAADYISIGLKSVPGEDKTLRIVAGNIDVDEYWRNLNESLNLVSKYNAELVLPIFSGLTDYPHIIKKAGTLASQYDVRLVLEEYVPIVTSFKYGGVSEIRLLQLAHLSPSETWIKTSNSGYVFVKPTD